MPLRPSRVLAVAVCAGHVAALAALWLTLPAPGAVVASLGVTVSACAFLRARSGQPRALHLHGDGTIDCIDAHGAVRHGHFTGAGIPAGWLVTIALRDTQGRATTLALLPDCSDRESLRRARAWAALQRGRTAPRAADRADSPQGLTRG